ncbi:MAG: hypothetical protein ABL957_07920 [Parvularculaceae bacterium]
MRMGPAAVIGRIFSIVGFSLSFGLQRMETILRVAWLPVTLLLVLDMATVFSILSIATGRFISFADVATYGEAQQALVMLWSGALMNDRTLTLWVVFGSIALQLVLISSFMAPLTRYAGLGERPAPGAMRLPFGPDQLRFILAYLFSFLILPALLLLPMAVTALYVINYISEVLSQYYAAFPNPDSLHTVEIIPATDYYAGQGRLWVYSLGLPVAAAAAPFALIAWGVLFAHFRPRGVREGGGGVLVRAVGSLIAGGGAVGLLWMFLLDQVPLELRAGIEHYVAIFAMAIVILLYGSIRALPYAGIAVCRRSLSFRGNGRVTRGWRLIWIFLALLLLCAFLAAVFFSLNFLFAQAWIALNVLFSATISATRLANSGEEGQWVVPVFLWSWNIFKIVFQMFVTFFTYGVFAGLLGRLYRESEIEEP